MLVRRAILEDSPFAGLVRKTFPNNPTGSHAFEYALEGYLRTVPELGSLDGFEFLHVAEDSPWSLRTIGLAWFLPSSYLPLDVSFHSVRGGISYCARLGVEDEAWKGLTKSRRWKAVYLYSTERCEPEWNWNNPIEGVLRPIRHH